MTTLSAIMGGSTLQCAQQLPLRTASRVVGSRRIAVLTGKKGGGGGESVYRVSSARLFLFLTPPTMILQLLLHQTRGTVNRYPDSTQASDGPHPPAILRSRQLYQSLKL